MMKKEEIAKMRKIDREKIIQKQGVRRLVHEKAKEEWFDKISSKVRPPEFLKSDNNTFELRMGYEGDVLPYVKLFKSTGCMEPGLGSFLVGQVADTMFGRKDIVQKLNICADLLNGINPQNELEAILIAQMSGTHNLAMEFMRRAVLSEQTIDGSDANVNKAFKLMSLFLRQVETLEKLRGKTGNQKVIVEHVNVNAGGQAIVGSVEAGTQGGDKKRDQG